MLVFLRQISLAAILAFLPSAAAQAEESQTAVGLTAGLLSGVGFAFRQYQPGGETAYHIGGLAYGSTDSHFFNIGVEWLKKMSEFDTSRLFWFVGSSFYQSFRRHEDCSHLRHNQDTPMEMRRCSSKHQQISAGGGLSFEYGATQGLSIVAELPLALRVPLDEGFRKASILPIPALILQYRL